MVFDAAHMVFEGMLTVVSAGSTERQQWILAGAIAMIVVIVLVNITNFRRGGRS